jgi:hypothetical protein
MTWLETRSIGKTIAGREMILQHVSVARVSSPCLILPLGQLGVLQAIESRDADVVEHSA